ELHREERMSAVFADLVHGDDVLVRESRRMTALTEEARVRLGVEHVVAHHLHGDRAPRRLIARAIDRPHRAAPELRLDAIAADRVARREHDAQTLKRKCTTSPSRITYSLPSIASLPASRHLASLPSDTRSSHQMTSALMKP